MQISCKHTDHIACTKQKSVALEGSDIIERKMKLWLARGAALVGPDAREKHRQMWDDDFENMPAEAVPTSEDLEAMLPALTVVPDKPAPVRAKRARDS